MTMKRSILATLATAAALLTTAGSASAAAASHTENLTFVFRDFATHGSLMTGSAVATGDVRGVGTVTAGQGDVFPVTVSLPGGTLYATVTSGPTTENFDPRACVDRVSGTDTVVVTGGTGAFAGASGSGVSTDRAVFVFGRNSDGSCAVDQLPVAGIIIARASLTLT